MGLFSSKKTTNITENRTDVSSFDNRVAATDDAIALGQGSSLDQSFYFKDESDRSTKITDNSDRRITDQSDRRDQRVFNLEQLSDDVAIASINEARALGESAFSLVNSGLADQARSQRENRLLAENAIGTIADTTRKNLSDTLSVIDGSTARALELAGKLALRGQDEAGAARKGAEKTIAEVLGFKEAGDTKVAESLIKYGAIAAALIAAALLFRGRKSTA